MPSTTSSSVSRLLASSTVITPSLPTFCIASAMMRPISVSPLAEIVPTWAISSLVETLRECALTSATAASTARSMPRFRSIGFRPAATALAPSLTIDWASTVAVVVPSPARSLVLVATSRTIWAPMFSNLSESSISLATVTPSLVIRGAPNDLSRTTLRPFGPSVTLTALARMSTPRSSRSRASVENLTSLAAIVWIPFICLGREDSVGVDHADDVRLLHDEVFLAVDLDLGARPLAEQDAVADLDVERMDMALIVAGARTGGDDLALLRLLLGGVGDDDAAAGLLLGIEATNHDAVMQRTEIQRHMDRSLAITALRHGYRPGGAVSTLPRRVPGRYGSHARVSRRDA